MYERLPRDEECIRLYWKPPHLARTGLLFFAVIIHMTRAFGS